MELNLDRVPSGIGAFPARWRMSRLGDLFQFSNGVNADKRAYGRGIPFVNVLEAITYTHLYGPEVTGRVSIPPSVAAAYELKRGDVLFNRTSETDADLGLASVYLGSESIVFGGFVIRGRPVDDSLDPRYSGYALRASAIRSQIVALGQGAVRANIGQERLRSVLIPVPPIEDQRAIADLLSDVDAQLMGQSRLIAKKRDLRMAAMQHLLTGRRRLPGFCSPWERKTIGEFAIPRGPKNTQCERLPVITCSKHHGFVDSLRYFKSQVFSDDLSSYRLINRGDIGYPANHIEEGSIGLQDLHDVALVSPIYVVFRTDVTVNSLFLHRLLKLDSYREHFKTTTTSSVDRRGSLRWPAFSRIAVDLPPLPEQNAIAAVLSDMDAELAALEARLEKTRDLKQAMMQELLTGRTRLVAAETAYA